MTTRDPLAQTLRRAATLSSRDKIGAVIAGPAERWRLSAFKDLALRNIFMQPKHQGTAYEVLLALLQLETRVPSTTPIVFLPSDHVVSDEEIMTRSLVFLSILELFRPKFDATITALRTALQADLSDPIAPRALTAIYDRLTPVDFSRDLLTNQADSLNVLRLPRCGWWPLKSPKRVPQISNAEAPLLDTGSDAGEPLGGH